MATNKLVLGQYARNNFALKKFTSHIEIWTVSISNTITAFGKTMQSEVKPSIINLLTQENAI